MNSAVYYSTRTSLGKFKFDPQDKKIEKLNNQNTKFTMSLDKLFEEKTDLQGESEMNAEWLMIWTGTICEPYVVSEVYIYHWYGYRISVQYFNFIFETIIINSNHVNTNNIWLPGRKDLLKGLDEGRTASTGRQQFLCLFNLSISIWQDLNRTSRCEL